MTLSLIIAKSNNLIIHREIYKYELNKEKRIKDFKSKNIFNKLIILKYFKKNH